MHSDGGAYTDPTGEIDMFAFGAILLNSHLLIAVADRVPNINLKETCRNAATVSGTLTQRDINICMEDEQGAHDEIARGWAQFSGTARAQCVHASTDYLPSYIEVLTCLEMARDVKRWRDETTTTPPAGKPRRQQ
jgi:hypothetical protein